MAGGLRRPADSEGLLTGLDGGTDGDRPVVGAAGVLGQLGGGADRTAPVERGDEVGVQPGALAGEEVVVDGFAEERVAEGVRPATGGGEHVGLDRGAERALELGSAEVGDGRQQSVAHLAPGHRDDADHATGRLVEPVEMDQQDVGELAGDLAGPGSAHKLLDEERVALGPVDDGDVLGLGHRRGVERADETAYVVVGERLEMEPVDATQPHPLSHLAAQWVAPVEIVGAVGDHERDTGEVAGEEEAEHVARGLVGPVGVLDDDEECSLPGDGGEEVAERVVDVAAVEGLVARRGVAAADAASRLEAGERGVLLEHACGDVGLIGHDAAEDLGEGEVGQGAVGEVEAVTGDDLPACCGRGVAQGHQDTRLAHARVAGEEHRADRLVSCGRANAELGGEMLQLGIASDEIGGPQGRHGRHCVVPLRQRGVDRGAGHFWVWSARARAHRRTP